MGGPRGGGVFPPRPGPATGGSQTPSMELDENDSVDTEQELLVVRGKRVAEGSSEGKEGAPSD